MGNRSGATIRRWGTALLVAGMGLALVPPVEAAVVDFETVPGGSPSVGLLIGTQYLADYGISFELVGGGVPRLCQVGGPVLPTGEPCAFFAFGLPDTPAPAQGVGSFFLHTDPPESQSHHQMLAKYATSVASASGVIIDVDNVETFLVEALNSSGSVLESLTFTAASAGAGDGLAMPWSFTHGVADIAAVRFTASFGSGFAYDNFSAPGPGPQPIPEPTTLVLLLSGLAGLYRVAWRRH